MCHTLKLDGAQWPVFMLPSPKRGIGSSTTHLQDDPSHDSSVHRRPKPSCRMSVDTHWGSWSLAGSSAFQPSWTHAITVTSLTRRGTWAQPAPLGRDPTGEDGDPSVDWNSLCGTVPCQMAVGCGPGGTATGGSLPHGTISVFGVAQRSRPLELPHVDASCGAWKPCRRPN